MKHDLRVGVICWIHAAQTPVSTPYVAEVATGLYYKPDWVAKVYMGLAATSNTPPPDPLPDFAKYRSSQNFRAMCFCHLTVETDRGNIVKVDKVSEIIDGGFTPPFDRGKFPLTKLKSEPSMTDPHYYPGEVSSVSKIEVRKRHTSSVIPSGQAAGIVVNGLVKFRAGAHTDSIGIKPPVSCPFHVPWVWSEFLVTYRDERFYMTAAGSQFPKHWWYAQDSKLLEQDEVSDLKFPTKGWTGQNIVVEALNLFPVLKAGAPASGPQPPKEEAGGGSVTSQQFTAPGKSPQTKEFRVQ
jgi:hypothetical protein